MSDLDRAEVLEMILDHHQNPRNHGEMPGADVHLQGGIPGCSDLITMYLKFQDDRVAEISFIGEGCTISQASASLLTEQVIGMSTEEINQLDFAFMIDLLSEEIVKTRPRCATLSLDTLRGALAEYRRKQIQG
jgi:nitrogen fixation protein NifU and related proteins